MTPAQQRTLAAIEAELGRLVRYDDESVVHDAWIRQVARALLVHPRYLPYAVVTAIAGLPPEGGDGARSHGTVRDEGL